MTGGRSPRRDTGQPDPMRQADRAVQPPTRNASSAGARPGHHRFAWLTLAVLLTLTLVAAVSIDRLSRIRHEARFQSAVQTTHDRIAARMEAYVALLRGAGALFAASEAVSRAEFHAYVERLALQRHYPGVQGIGFTPRVEPSRREAFVEAVRREGFADFRIWPPGERDPLFAIQYLEPMDARNRAALGFDMYSEPVRREAMARARDAGAAAASGKVLLKQEIDAQVQSGFLLYLPVYAGGAIPADVALRRSRLTGFVYAPFRMGDLFAGLFGAEPGQRIGLRVHDGPQSSADSLLYDASPAAAPSATGLSAARTIDVAGRPWTIAFHSLPGFVSTAERLLAPVVGLLGVVVSLVLFGLIRAQSRARDAIEAGVAARTAALEQERTQRNVAETLSSLALILGSQSDPESLIQRFTDEARRLTGAAYGAYFHNLADEAGNYGLYTLSGASKATFAGYPPHRATPMFTPTFAGRTVRLDDVRQSPDFGRNPPNRGMPAGHLPVASYLAVAVRAHSGQVLGALMFAHPQAGRFTGEHERLVEGIAAQAAVALENARLLQAERAARLDAEARKTLLDSVIEHSGEGIVVADAQGVLRIFNPAAQRQHGIAHRQVAAPEWADAYGLHTLEGEPLALQDTPLYRATLGETVTDARWRVRRPDGSWRTLIGTATPLRAPTGEAAGGVLVVRDETERMESDAQREALVEALARSNKELDQFAYVASHDLKAPLRGIANLSQWIEEDLGGDLADSTRQHLDLLRGRVHRLEGLIDGILMYSRAGRARDASEDVDVAALVAEVVELLSPRPEAIISVRPGLPTVRTGRVPLQQVFLNLVGNALKYAQRPDVRIEIGCRDRGQRWEFFVKDDGPGIEPQYHERIWGIFQRLQARDEVEGTGIGLSVVRKVVEARGGRAWVESQPGRGATFLFTWPK